MNIVKCAECGNEYDYDYPALGRVSQEMDVPICPLCQVLIEEAEAYLAVMSEEGTGKEETGEEEPSFIAEIH